MAHAQPQDLADLEVLLSELRKVEILKEKSMGCFYRKSKSVLHFHVKGSRRFAHVFDGEDWKEFDLAPKPSVSQQRVYFKKLTGFFS